MRPRSRFACCRPGQYGGERDHGGHGREQRTQQRRLVSDQEHVDVGAAERGHRGADRDEQEAGEQRRQQGGLGAAHPCGHRAHDARFAATAAEVVGGFEDQRHTGEAGVEVLHRHETAALVGVVDVDAPAAEAAAHAVVDDVVVELPEQDGRRLHLGERGGFHLHALGLQSVAAGGLEQVAGARAVTGDAAGDAQLLQRDVLAVVGEHHGERGGAALQGLHLKDRGGAHRLALGGLGGRRDVPARAAAAAGRGLGAVPPAPGRRQLLLRRGRGVVWCGHGSSQSIGCCAARCTEPPARVMESTAYGGPSEFDQA